MDSPPVHDGSLSRRERPSGGPWTRRVDRGRSVDRGPGTETASHPRGGQIPGTGAGQRTDVAAMNNSLRNPKTGGPRRSRLCSGCSRELPPRQRCEPHSRPRRWCSEPCRQRAFRATHPEYVERRRLLAAQRQRSGHTVYLVCRTCDTPFEHRVPRSGRRPVYCSNACRPPGRRRGVTRTLTCARCPTIFETRKPNRRYCSTRCARNTWRETPNPIPWRLRRRVLERDAWTCYLDGRPIRRDVRWPHPLSPSVDHVVPRAAGGSDDPANLRAAHWGCNQAKGDALPGTEIWVPQGVVA